MVELSFSEITVIERFQAVKARWAGAEDIKQTYRSQHDNWVLC